LQKILIITLILLITAPAFAATYLLQDVEHNDSYRAYLMTLDSGNNTFILGIMTPNGKHLCYVDSISQKANANLMGGRCVEAYKETNPKIYYWTEVEPDTFYNEVQNIIEERKNQGLYLRNYEGN